VLQENITAMISFHFCAIFEEQNADDAITFRVSSDDKVRERYASTTSSVSAGDTITSIYCRAVYHAQQSTL